MYDALVRVLVACKNRSFYGYVRTHLSYRTLLKSRPLTSKGFTERGSSKHTLKLSL